MELGIPVIMAINMMDIVEKKGDKIHIDKLSEKLGCEVVEISALKGNGIKELANKAVKLAESKRKIKLYINLMKRLKQSLMKLKFFYHQKYLCTEKILCN